MKRFVCVVCPKSCELAVEMRGSDLFVDGDACERGTTYARQEMYDPQRILTTTVKLSTGGLLPVRSRCTVKKSELIPLTAQLRSVTVRPPVEIGQIILLSHEGTHIEIIASGNG